MARIGTSNLDAGSQFDDGIIAFTDGRHRFSWLRDHGVKTLPVACSDIYADAIEFTVFLERAVSSATKEAQAYLSMPGLHISSLQLGNRAGLRSRGSSRRPLPSPRMRSCS